ncbi:thioredoxin-like protein [Coniochaeta sp. 2T2.1]|nr:thioredoxin-like protein [Coniochaeta sp. 2T2.1]
MFGFRKTKDIITLFHKSSTPSSTKVLTLLKQVSANASEAATEDQASDHTAQTHPKRAEFDLDVTEKPPTPDQLMTILDYVGNPGVVIPGTSSVDEAMQKFKQDSESFKRPVVVDWNNGKAAVGDNESAILKMLDELPKK